MGPLIQQVCLVTFLIFFACSTAPVADGTETERQSTSVSTCTLYGLNSTVWFAGCVTFGIIIFLEVVFLVWYKYCRDASQNLLGVFHVVGGEDTSTSPHPKTPKAVSMKDTNMNLDLPHSDTSTSPHPKTPKAVSMKEARSHEVDVVLDRKTAHSQLKISHNGKVVEWVKQKQEPQTEIDKNDIDKHFDEAPYVLGSMGRAMRAYWEVSVKEKKDWVLGVTRATANRKGQLVLSPANGFWVIGISDGKDFTAFMDDDDVFKEITLHRVGIYVDYQERKVTFYNAEDSSLIYSFTNGPSYEDDVCPLFSPWNNDIDPIRILSIETKKLK
ncbi:ret finger protein-like 4A isoform X9 [Salmo salar]|uniref:Ret finger protein-like 4A isoform X7 n=1 Tax=Salmo salar TaxID=8030 RepID=A0ABM3DF47_SALSA|nr:ret finger protein-like 4A isoform X7 [Salmo salar]XP_045557431.1 ret finger protein-like 4A isoform X8 [Salmo salar]XP_045557432.1 ret finger protein-like 4A isoform X9 [Salmo salar]